jgi:hypothetical protein
MHKVTGRFLAPVIVGGLACGGLSADPPESGRVPTTAVQQAIERLGSPRHADREAATRELIAYENARLYVEPLTRSKDEEVAARARRILNEHDRRFAPMRLGRLFRYGREGQVERMVEGLARWPGPIDTELYWEGLFAVLRDIQDRSPHAYSVNDSTTKSKSMQFPGDLWATFRKAKIAPNFQRLSGPLTGKVHLLCVSSVDHPVRARQIGASVIVSTGPVSAGYHGGLGIVLTNADFDCDDPTHGSLRSFIVVSAGSIKLGEKVDVDRSLLVSRGGISAGSQSIVASHLTSTGKIDAAPRPLNKRLASKIEAEQERPLGFIRWFETTTVGFEITPESRGMRVSEVLTGSVAAAGGLRTGDVIAAVDGQRAGATAEEFRKQIRRGSVQDACAITVIRDSKELTLNLDFQADNRK